MAGSADHATTRSSMDDEDQAAAEEADQILARRKSRAAAAGKAAKTRIMSESEISLIMSLKPCEIPSDEDDDLLELLSRRHPDKYTPEALERRRRRREHKELVEMLRQDDEEIAARQAEIMRELAEKGYVETDEVDQTYVDEINEWGRVQWERLAGASERLSRVQVVDKEEEEYDKAFRSFLLRQQAAEETEEEDDEDYYSDEDDADDTDAAAAESSSCLQTDRDSA